MDVSARDIEAVEFHDAWRGYNQAEVDDFLDQVSETVERLTRENTALRARLQEIETSVESARVSEDMMKKTLLAAEKTAQDTIAEARAQAEQIVADASSGLDVRKGELESSLASLHRFESETKQRLRALLEEQLRALDSLHEHSVPEPQVAEVVVTETSLEQEAEVAEPRAEEPQIAPPEAIAELAAENRPADEIDEPSGEADTSLFEFDDPDVVEDGEASMDDFRPFDDEAALQSRRRRGLFRRRVDDWA